MIIENIKKIIQEAKGIIFDIDNTLVNSFNADFKKHTKTARIMGLIPPNKSKYRKVYGGLSLTNMIKYLYNDKVDLVQYKKIAHKSTNYNDFKPLGNINKIFTTLKKFNKKIGIISNSELLPSTTKLKNINVDMGMIDSIRCSDTSKYHKPDPKVFDEILNELKLKEEEVIFIGDTLHDFIAARSRGIFFVAVIAGISSKKDFIDLGLNQEFIVKNIDSLFIK